MGELSVSAVIIEREDGSYTASCPELGIEVGAESSDEAFDGLRAAVQKRVREAGPGLQLNPVKCLKFKVQAD